MISFDSLKRSVAKLVVGLTGLPVVWQDQNANTESGDYVLLKITGLERIGFNDSTAKPDVTGIATTQGDREFILSLQAISKNGMEILAGLDEKLNLKSTLPELHTKKLAYIGLDGSISDITTQIDGRFEQRSTVDLRFRISKNYSSDTGDDVGVIETIPIASTVGTFENDFIIDTP